VNGPNGEQELIPGGVRALLTRRAYLLLAPMVILGAGSYVKTLDQQKVYSANARIYVVESSLDSPLLDSYVMRIDLETQLQTLKKTADGRDLARRVAAAIADSTGGEEPAPASLQLQVDVGEDGTVRLAAEASDPDEARVRTAALRDVVAAQINEPRVEAATEALTFIQDELAKAQRSLDAAHLSLNEYRSANGKVLPELEAITYNLLLSLEAEQVELDARRGGLQQERTMLEADPAVRSGTVKGLRDQIGRLEVDLQSAAGRLTERHPDLQKMRARLDRLRLDLRLREQGVTPPEAATDDNPAAVRYRALLIEQEALEKRIDQVADRVRELQVKIAAASGHDAEYVRRLRDVESLSEIYLDLVRRRERAATSLHLVMVNHGDIVRTVLEPLSPSVPVSPRPLFDLALGLVAGLVAGLGLAALAEIMDRRVWSGRALAAALGAPTLASAGVQQPERTS
jgi:succinoglycan biosynthesis transport protein ExoP